MTAAFVILTAIVGLVVGPAVIRGLAIQSSVAQGAMLGMGAHGLGTARAFELGAEEGTVASLSMIIAAGVTAVMTALFFHGS